MSQRIRFSTLVSKNGPLKLATACSEREWQQAVQQRRFFTVYHGENDWCTPLLGRIGHHGCVNTICKVVFARPLPAETTEVIGMRNNDAAFALVNQAR
jgi:hypothetical protein